MIGRLVKKCRDYIVYRRLIKDQTWFRLLRREGISYGDLGWSHEKKCPVLRKYDLQLEQRNWSFLISGYDHLKRLSVLSGFKIFSEGKKILICLEGLTFVLDSKQELLILEEIYHSRCYGYHFSEPSIVLDIGLNAGMAALFFAAIPKVRRVIGYEPAGPTRDKAGTNLELNIKFANKVVIKPYGLGAENRKLKVPFNDSKKGNLSLTDVNSKNISNFMISVEVRNATEELRKVLEQRLKEKVVVKMDCEGCEYEVIEKWSEDGILDQIDILLMEYHGKDSGNLLEHLTKAGFKCFDHHREGKLGYIYACT